MAGHPFARILAATLACALLLGGCSGGSGSGSSSSTSSGSSGGNTVGGSGTGNGGHVTPSGLPGPQLVIDAANYQLVSSQRVDRTHFDYTYRVNVSNAGDPATRVVAIVSSAVATTVVTDGNVSFGDVAALGTVTSTDTFTIRQDRTVPFDPSKLTWQIDVAHSYVGSGLRLLVSTDDGTNVSVLPGERISRSVILSKADAGINAELHLDAPPTGVELIQTNGTSTLTFDASNLSAGTLLPVTVVAKNLDNGSTERVSLILNVLTPVVVASGRLTFAGGVVASPGGAFGVQIDAGQLASPLGVTISTAVTPNGTTKLRVKFDRDVSGDTGVITLISNDAAQPATFGSGGAAAQTTRVTAQSLSFSPYPVSLPLQNFPAYFLDALRGEHRLAKNSNVLSTISKTCVSGPDVICLEYDPQAATLTSSMSGPDLLAAKAGPAEIVPVLFINGFLPSNFGRGGGETTWNDFPKLVRDLSGPEKLYVPFEFRWRTDASFSAVADQLATAIIRVHGLTGQPIRIIAHSFGGVLVRTLLQGLAANNQNFDRGYVRSVMTLGTPHSGTFDSETTDSYGRTFPVGQDSSLFSICDQISCWQTGVDGFFSQIVLDLTAAGDRGNVASYLADTNKLVQTPFTVGIGLKREDFPGDAYDGGDGLIAFNGQRFSPDLAEPVNSFLFGFPPNKLLLACNSSSVYGGMVREVVLGGSADTRPFSPVVNNVRGYSHSESGGLFSTSPDSDSEYAEPYVECADLKSCTHAALNLFIDTLDQPKRYCEDENVVLQPPVLTLVGSEVTLTDDYPTLGSHITIPYKSKVSDGVEFPSGSIQSSSFLSIIGSDSDVGATSIDINFTMSATAATATFNGEVYDFDSSSPTIVGVALDPLSTFSSNQVKLDYGPHRVTINDSGVRIPIGARILVNLTLAPPSVPPAPRISDGDFAAWALFSFITDDPRVIASGPGTSSGSLAILQSGGNPGRYLDLPLTVAYGDTIWAGGVKTDYTYDPAVSGAIGTLLVGIDVRMPSSGATAWQSVVEQDGRRYYSFPFGAFSGTPWSRVSAAHLHAADFDTNPWAGNANVPPDGNRPDFGPTGGALQFGVMIGNTINGHGVITVPHGVDNFSVDFSPP